MDGALTCDYIDGALLDSAIIVPDIDEFTPLIAFHAIAATYVLVLGPLQILRARRDLAHRIIGATWVAGIVAVCISSYWITPDGFSWLHGLSTWTLLCMVLAIAGIRAGSVTVHRSFMIGSYLGTLTAFAFAALVPERLIPQLLRSDPVIAIGTRLGIALLAAVFHLAVVRALARGSGGRPGRGAGPASGGSRRSAGVGAQDVTV